MLKALQGYELPFIMEPQQISEPKVISISDKESLAIDASISKLLESGAIVLSEEEQGQFISRIFTVPKPDGSPRPIINLKPLNEFINADHFKMEDCRTAMALMIPNCYMAVIDQKDAYHAIPIANHHQKYLKFRWKGNLYKYTCVPFGLNVAPRLFTKVMKPVFCYLRSKKYLSVTYLDDCLLLGSTFSDCQKNVKATIELFRFLGLIITAEKSQLIPSKNVRYLGFILDSLSMTISLPLEKRNKIVSICMKVKSKEKMEINSVAELIGVLTSACPAVFYGQLYTRQLETEKIKALEKSNGNYMALMKLSNCARSDIQWWIKNIPLSSRSIQADHIDMVLTTDASMTGWGAHSNEISTKGSWSENEARLHINELELLAVYYGLRTCIKTLNVVVLCRVDNTTALAYINKFGGCRSTRAHKIAKMIWQWCEERRIWLIASYINTKDNIIADSLSRTEKDQSDFMLKKEWFKYICAELGSPKIDLFASYQTAQCHRYFSWLPDPGSEGVDAFTYKWTEFFYAFPPFNLITRVLKKVQRDKITGIVVAPLWPTQPWYPLYKILSVSDVIIIKAKNDLLYDPYSGRSHLLGKKTSLMAAVLSGNR